MKNYDLTDHNLISLICVLFINNFSLFNALRKTKESYPWEK